MTKIALATAAILVATGSAFAGSDHYGANNANQPVAPVTAVDHTFTGSFRKSTMTDHNGADNTTATTEAGGTVTDIIARHNNEGLWGK